MYNFLIILNNGKKYGLVEILERNQKQPAFLVEAKKEESYLRALASTF